MNTQNKLVLGLFSLAFVSLGGLQAASQYINYSQSSVLGDQTSYFSQIGGKANFNSCTVDSDCASGYCQLSLKRCLPVSNARIATSKPQLSLPPIKISPTIALKSSNIPCSAAQSLYEQYCNHEFPQINVGQESNSITCAQYQDFLSQNCTSVKPTTAPSPIPITPPVISCHLSKYTITNICPIFSPGLETTATRVSYTCSNGYTNSYLSSECKTQTELKKIALDSCFQQNCPPAPAPTYIIPIEPSSPVLPPITRTPKATAYPLPTITSYCGNSTCEGDEACEWDKVKSGVGICKSGSLTNENLLPGHSCNQYCQIIDNNGNNVSSQY